MPSAKSGTECSLVAPIVPDDAKNADDADPGAVDEAKAKEQYSSTPGKYTSVPVKPFKPQMDEDGKPKTGWVEVALTDEDGKPVAGEPYAVTLPDGSVASGTTGADGVARVEGFDPGSCQITFPARDQEAWHAA